MLFLLSILVVCLFVALHTNILVLETYYMYILPFVYFGLNVYYIVRYKKGEILNFEFFFALSYFLCCFLTPIILPSLDRYTSRIFEGNPMTHYRTYIICLIGYLFYMLGLIKNRKFNSLFVEKITFNESMPIVSNIICLFTIVLFFLSGGIALLTLYSSNNEVGNRLGDWGSLLTYAIITYTISALVNFVCLRQKNKNIFSLSKIFLLNSSILIVMLALSGYRSNLIQIVIPLIFIYNTFYKRIMKWKILICLLLGIAFMIVTGLTRKGDSFDLETLDFVTITRDFMFANAANIYLIDYADSHGITYGTNWLLQILSIVPLLQRLFINIFTDFYISQPSSRLFTNNMDTNFGLGTGIIGDIYYSTGIIGVCLLMFLLGYICKKLSSCKSILLTSMFLCFLGNSIFVCRVEYFYIIRIMAFSAIIMWLELKISRLKS